ncbi:MAG: hypothetical protein JST40_11395 [Armatimonadetes bacterium]|nr:hypothetical protein [Armatimonadota bacterium]
MKRMLILIGIVLILGPWIWAFTAGRATAGVAQGSGTSAYYLSIFTVPLGILLIIWGILRSDKAPQ